MSASGELRRAKGGGRNDWQTPPVLWARLEDQFGGFGVDVACSPSDQIGHVGLHGPHNDESCDCGLCAHWCDYSHGFFAWCNPPYGGGLAQWIDKAVEELVECAQSSVLLVPAAPDTKWWKKAYDHASEVRLLSGRVKFINPATGKPDGSNTTGSTVFVFERTVRPRTVFLWDWRSGL